MAAGAAPFGSATVTSGTQRRGWTRLTSRPTIRAGITATPGPTSEAYRRKLTSEASAPRPSDADLAPFCFSIHFSPVPRGTDTCSNITTPMHDPRRRLIDVEILKELVAPVEVRAPQAAAPTHGTLTTWSFDYTPANGRAKAICAKCSCRELPRGRTRPLRAVGLWGASSSRTTIRLNNGPRGRPPSIPDRSWSSRVTAAATLSPMGR